jgi:hypothetical protein
LLCFRRDPTIALMDFRDHDTRPVASPAEEAAARKARSIARLKREGIPVLEMLPAIESEAEARRRSTSDVAQRALALATVAVKAEGHGQATSDEVMAFTRDLVQQFELSATFSQLERTFIEDAEPGEHDIVQFSWRYECYWTLLWALGFVDALERPSTLCDPAKAIEIMVDLGRSGFLERATLRPLAEILDETDLIYRYHWAVVDARLRGETVPGIHGGVVFERHYALNWLIGHGDVQWDDISTDT